MRITRRQRKSFFRYGVIAFGIVFLFSAALLCLRLWEKQQSEFSAPEMEESVVTYEGTEYVQKDSIETFLVMGLDKFEGETTDDAYNNDQQADFLMLLVFDDAAKTCSAVHINRDTMVDMNVLGVAGQKISTVNKQIALAHTYGNGREMSCRNTADAVSELLQGVKVGHYVSLTMDSVPLFNDLLGGVEVIVQDDFTGIDPTLVQGEKITLMGEQALHYVRTRRELEDSSNSTRMQRQRQYLSALYEKLQQRMASDEEFVVEASIKMADYIVSDRSVTRLQELVKKFAEYDFVGIRSMEGENVLGEKFMEFYPREESVRSIIMDLFYIPKE